MGSREASECIVIIKSAYTTNTMHTWTFKEAVETYRHYQKLGYQCEIYKKVIGNGEAI